ncbi:MAG: oligosaccharide flippase family protein [Bacteroidetes bacterium]|nr:oligosaccharide flippase family protein [Bacteroidota bacterium]
MQRKFVSNLILIVVLNLLVKPVSLFWIDAGVQNRVGAEEYGTYYVLLNITVLFNILLDLGINNFTTKNIAQYPHLAPRYFSKTWSFRMVAFIGYVLCTLPFVLLLDLGEKGYYLLCFLLFNQLLIGLIAYARAHFAGLHLFRWDALFSILDRLLLILSCGGIFLISSESFQIEWFVYCLSGSYIVSVIVSYAVLSKKVGMPKFKLDKIFIFSIVKRSFPYALLILLMMLYTRVDTFMIAYLHPNQQYEVGIYAQGFRVLDAFFMFAMLFAGLLFPIFSRQIHNRIDNLSLMSLSSRILVGGAIWLGWACYENSTTILGWIYQENIAESAPSFKLLMLSFIGICIAILNSTLLTAFGEMKKLNQIALISIGVNVLLNFWLIPERGAEGAALATLITQCGVALVYFLYSWQYFGQFKYLMHLVHLLMYGILLWIISTFYPGNKEGVLFSSLGFIALFVIGLWQPKTWVLLLKKVQNTKETQEVDKMND